MSKFRPLYEFTILKEQEVDEPVELIQEDGTVIHGTKKVVKEVPYEFAIKKPNREDTERAELFYSKTVGEGLQAGLISSALLTKRYLSDGGIFTEAEKERRADLQEKLREVLEKISDIEKKTSEERSEEEKEQYNNLNKEMFKLTSDLQEFAIAEYNLYENAAETKARSKTISWFNLELLHKKIGDSYESVFKIEDENTSPSTRYKKKIKLYDELVESLEDNEKENKFWGQVISKALGVVTVSYYQGWALKPEEIDKLLSGAQV